MFEKEEIENLAKLFLFSIVPIILIYITMLGITFLFTNEISYSLGFWIYLPISIFLGLILTSWIQNRT